jgi:hypothetical protein
MGKTNIIQDMALSPKNDKVQPKLTKEEKALFDRLAAADDRSTSNFTARILREWLIEKGHLTPSK